ncbi:helix-turn-helix transcriptional regulator [Colwellia psychrerythraea]|uniref:Prophage CP4-57 regulatory n=1 Tax=Colwellia psychrerythraea TaxID=28229 RepID=A0A099KGX5_COLPS|nr:helix-turn-helix domain-containing protein [Colwellia psychrerythraea]KGJ89515.1 Prophage CP4-57 regulatory [Colwellia psychrerythraea]
MSHQLLTTKQVCDLFVVTDRTIYNWSKKNPNFPKAIKLGGTNKYRQSDIESFIDSLTANAA